MRKFQFSTSCSMPSPSVGAPTLWGQQFTKYFNHFFSRNGGKIFQIVQRNKFSCWRKATLFEQDVLSEETDETPVKTNNNNFALQWKQIRKNILIWKGFSLPTSCLPEMTVTALVSSSQTMVNTVFDNISRRTMKRYLFPVCLNQYLSVWNVIYFELL